MSLMRLDPYREMLSLRDAMNRLFEESVVPSSMRRAEREPSAPVAVDMYEVDGEIVVKSDLPGIDPEDVDISISDNMLTIKGQFEAADEEEKGNIHIQERRYGAFQRSIALPSGVEATKTEAEFDDGVLRVTLPKVEEEKPKRIEVKAK